MLIGRVVGNIVATIKHPVYRGRKLLLVQPLNVYGKSQGSTVLAVDMVGAGVGEMVLVSSEGRSARELLGDPRGPVRTLILGIIDQIKLAE